MLLRPGKELRERMSVTLARQGETLIPWQIPPLLEKATRAVRTALSRVHYLGPLRSPAKRYYVASLDEFPGMDPAGEFLPYVLRDRLRTSVSFVAPGAIEVVSGTLDQALNAWMYYIRTGEVPELKSKGKEINVAKTKVLVEFEINSVNGQGAHALADSGFGYSHVLPILVRGLMAPARSSILVEQPELHLNPSLQVRLAYFFVSLIRAGKQVVLETHSEHLVNAIRVFAAEDESGELAGKCGILFIDAEGAKPTLHDLTIRPDGTVADWPANFFGEVLGLTMRLLRAQRRFRSSDGMRS